MNYNKEPLGSLCLKVSSGGTPKSTNAEYYDGGTIPWLNTKEVNFCRIYDTEKKITQLGLDNSAAKIIEPNRVIVAMYGATAARVAINKIELSTNQACCNLKIDPNKADYEYVYYCLLNEYEHLASLANGGAQQNLNSLTIKNFKIPVPDLKIQKKIVRVLSALDQKIELNSQKNGTYFNICRSLLNNYLSAEDLEEHDLSEFLDVFTGKRNANETSPDGKYIFFSCAPEPLKADTYIFDGSAIIIAGNGAYTGRTRFYEGKMELYQRTYACTPKNNDIQPLIYGFYVYMKNKFEQEKMGGTHGSAIPYIVIGDITKYKILYDKERFEKFSTQVKPFAKAIQKNENESIILANLRNSLLPKLMSGETNMKKALTNE